MLLCCTLSVYLVSAQFVYIYFADICSLVGYICSDCCSLKDAIRHTLALKISRHICGRIRERNPICASTRAARRRSAMLLIVQSTRTERIQMQLVLSAMIFITIIVNCLVIDDKNQKNAYNIMKMTGRATVISVMVMMPLIAIIGIYCCDFQCN